uniref:hypothetical protein n=1 Tax=Klebsiella pneumoniae TaxID=573 RepID=UPI0025A0653D
CDTKVPYHLRKAMLSLLVGIEAFLHKFNHKCTDSKRGRLLTRKITSGRNKGVANKLTCHNLTQQRDNREPMGNSQLGS